MATTVGICNQALAEIGAESIASIDEDNPGANQCKRVFDQVLEELLDWHDWSFRINRVVLAQVANDRNAEWNYAYAKPADFLRALAVREQQDEADQLPASTFDTLPWQNSFPIRFLIEGSTIYVNVENATLVYVRRDLAVNDLPAKLVRAFVLELASRISYPIKKDAKLKDGLIRMAEVARQRAIADDANRAPSTMPRYVTETEIARLG